MYDAEDIFDLIGCEKGFNKIYLSNAVGYRYNTGYNNTKNRSIREQVEVVAGRLPVGGLAYVANHDIVAPGRLIEHNYSFASRWWTYLKGERIESTGLPSGLEVDQRLTARAMLHNEKHSCWNPAVYRKIA